MYAPWFCTAVHQSIQTGDVGVCKFLGKSGEGAAVEKVFEVEAAFVLHTCLDCSFFRSRG